MSFDDTTAYLGKHCSYEADDLLLKRPQVSAVAMSEPSVAQRINHIRKAWHEGRPAYGVISKAPGASLARTLAGLRRYGLDASFGKETKEHEAEG